LGIDAPKKYDLRSSANRRPHHVTATRAPHREQSIHNEATGEKQG
jgi:hypothetical protein